MWKKEINLVCKICVQPHAGLIRQHLTGSHLFQINHNVKLSFSPLPASILTESEEAIMFSQTYNFQISPFFQINTLVIWERWQLLRCSLRSTIYTLKSEVIVRLRIINLLTIGLDGKLEVCLLIMYYTLQNKHSTGTRNGAASEGLWEKAKDND